MSDDGRFSGVPHEMIEILMRMQLSGHETRLIWFFIRNLQGYQMQERLIELDDIVFGTGMRPERVCEALKTLLQRKVLKRSPGSKKGEYIYQWNEKLFGRTHATKTVRIDPKIIRLEEYRSKSITENRNAHYGNPEQPLRKTVMVITENSNENPPKPATIKARRVAKDSIKDKRNILKKGKLSDDNGQNGKEYAEPSEKVRTMFPQFFKKQSG